MLTYLMQQLRACLFKKLFLFMGFLACMGNSTAMHVTENHEDVKAQAIRPRPSRHDSLTAAAAWWKKQQKEKNRNAHERKKRRKQARRFKKPALTIEIIENFVPNIEVIDVKTSFNVDHDLKKETVTEKTERLLRNQSSILGCNALLEAADEGDEFVLEELLKIMKAIDGMDKTILGISGLQDPKISLKAKDGMGRTALHKCIWQNHRNAFDVLLKYATLDDLNAQEDNHGLTALHIAVGLTKALDDSPDNNKKSEQNRLYYVQELVKRGVDLNLQSRLFAETPLHTAFEREKFKEAVWLLLHGARTDIPNFCGNTAEKIMLWDDYQSQLLTALKELFPDEKITSLQEFKTYYQMLQTPWR